MNTWEQDYWHGDNPFQRANFALMTIEPEPPPRFRITLPAAVIWGSALCGAIGWVLGRVF